MRNGMQQIKIKKCVCKNATVSGVPCEKRTQSMRNLLHSSCSWNQMPNISYLCIVSLISPHSLLSYHTYLALSPSLPSHTPIHLSIYVPWMYCRPRYFVGRRMEKRILQKTLPRYRETLFSYLIIANHFPSALWNVMWCDVVRYITIQYEA